MTSKEQGGGKKKRRYFLRELAEKSRQDKSLAGGRNVKKGGRFVKCCRKKEWCCEGGKSHRRRGEGRTRGGRSCRMVWGGFLERGRNLDGESKIGAGPKIGTDESPVYKKGGEIRRGPLCGEKKRRKNY